MIQSRGYEAAFLWFGIGQGIVVLMCALLLRAPQPGEVPAVLKPQVQQSTRDFTWLEMVQTPAFWVLYVMFTAVAMGGLMATAQLVRWPGTSRWPISRSACSASP